MAENRIGAKLTTLRESLQLSVQELAERCDCDVSVIEGLEGGRIAPSLAPLIKVSRALGVRLGTLLDDDTNVGPVVTRRDEAQAAARVRSLETASDGGVLDFFSLASGKTARHMEPFIVDVNPAEESAHSLSSHEGEEFMFVLAGSIEIAYGKELYTLAEGDSIYYDSIVPHQVRAAGGTAARILAVVYASA
ncbi:MAG: DNA-binding protein [Actinobacteria bacterium HGW-Actinobacteria-10]|jgi:transcriptional regulator with XRE-family HTH domain|nr:MAG: DNA-binding protein [Actinobacteria bacterium HGW-Actinobacteria-10]